jgi:hypothetical protein
MSRREWLISERRGGTGGTRQVGGGATVNLPTLTQQATMSVAQALSQRRSLREYADQAITGEQLAWVLSAATAITAEDGSAPPPPRARSTRSRPTWRCAGSMASTPAFTTSTSGLRPSSRLRTGSVAGDLMIAGLGQDFLRTAPVVLVLTGLFQRTRWK